MGGAGLYVPHRGSRHFLCKVTAMVLHLVTSHFLYEGLQQILGTANIVWNADFLFFSFLVP